MYSPSCSSKPKGILCEVLQKLGYICLRDNSHIQISLKYKRYGIGETSSGALGGSGGKEKCSKTCRSKERLDVKEKTQISIRGWVQTVLVKQY